MPIQRTTVSPIVPLFYPKSKIGLIIGVIYGLMALGLTLIFSILGVVSFSHGEFYMIGGMITYYVTVVWFQGISLEEGILIACVATFILGALFERLFLTFIYDGRMSDPRNTVY